MAEYMQIAYLGFFLILSIAGIVLNLILPLVMYDETQKASWLLTYIFVPAIIVLLIEAIKFLGNELERIVLKI